MPARWTSERPAVLFRLQTQAQKSRPKKNPRTERLLPIPFGGKRLELKLIRAEAKELGTLPHGASEKRQLYAKGNDALVCHCNRPV